MIVRFLQEYCPTDINGGVWYPIDMSRIFAMLLLFSLSFISTAHSQIAGPVTCDSAAEGKIIYNEDEKIMQFCNGSVWLAMGAGGARTDCDVGSGLEWDGSEWVCTVAFDPCSGSPSVGTTCADGSIYAGTTVGGVPMYAAPADETGTFTWATVNQNNPNAQSLSDGQANHDDIVTNRPLSNYPAFEACEDLNVANYLGRDDWYLPAQDELDTLFDARNTGDFSGTFGSGWYWSSSEYFSLSARNQRFSDGGQNDPLKSDTHAVRCVRR